jgi:hypothetical protein
MGKWCHLWIPLPWSATSTNNHNNHHHFSFAWEPPLLCPTWCCLPQNRPCHTGWAQAMMTAVIWALDKLSFITCFSRSYTYYNDPLTWHARPNQTTTNADNDDMTLLPHHQPTDNNAALLPHHQCPLPMPTRRMTNATSHSTENNASGWDDGLQMGGDRGMVAVAEQHNN